MPHILDTIVADKRLEVARQKQAIPLERLKDQLAGLPKCRNFIKAVTQAHARGINVIAEVKKASPSAGLIREDFDPVAIAGALAGLGAGLFWLKRFSRRTEKDAAYQPVILRKQILTQSVPGPV